MIHPELTDLLKEKKYSEIRAILSEMNEVDIAEEIEELYDENEQETLLKLFRLLPKELAAESFSYMESDVQHDLISVLTDKELSYILDDMHMDDYVDLIEEMPANVVKRLLSNSSAENRSLINEYLRYPEDSAGSVMTNEYVYLKKNMTVKEAFDVIRNIGVDKETIYTCYVMSDARKLEGVVTVKELLLSNPETRIEEIMSRNVIYAHTLDDKEEIAKTLFRYDMLSLPVVDNEERLVGIVTVDDSVDVMQEETTEDFERMAGITDSGDETYLKTPAWKLAKSRFIWLLILMFSSMISGALLEKYEAAISAIPLLVSFIPMLMGTAGNAGTQASTVIIRGLALDELEPKDVLRAWWKEIRISLLIGVVLAIVNYARLMIQYHDNGVALTVSLTLIAAIFVAKSMGCLLPMLASKLKIDPAMMATPILATVVDAASILVYFFLATQILSQRLGL